VKITLTTDTATPHLQRLLSTAKSPRTARMMLGAGAKAVQVEISRHLRALQARGNQKGWPSKGFFAGKPGSVERNVGVSGYTANEVVISIADPRFVHRLEGGTVTGKRMSRKGGGVKKIAVPLTAEAYAASGKGSLDESMPGLRAIKLKNGKSFLVRTRGKSTEFLFVLKDSVTHSKHPEEAPDENALAKAGLLGMDLAAKRLLAA